MKVDPEFRPEYSWNNPLMQRLLRVKGDERQVMAMLAIAEGTVNIQSRDFDEERHDLESIHPKYIGGEYLPAYLEEEVEIARVVLMSTTRDVTSIRARPAGGGFKYRVCDEYGTHFRLKAEESEFPLKLSELVDLIDGAQPETPEARAGLVFGVLEQQLALGATPAAEFIEVRSILYAALWQLYRSRVGEWLGSRPQS